MLDPEALHTVLPAQPLEQYQGLIVVQRECDVGFSRHLVQLSIAKNVCELLRSELPSAHVVSCGICDDVGADRPALIRIRWTPPLRWITSLFTEQLFARIPQLREVTDPREGRAGLEHF